LFADRKRKVEMSGRSGDGFKTNTEGGVAGSHPAAETFRLRLAPSTDAVAQNLARFPLIPIACWRVDDFRFQFDSSFVLPEVRAEMVMLSFVIAKHTRTAGNPPPISIFGHADPVGNDEYNKLLSGRRAAAIYGMLTRRAEVWEDLYSNTGGFAEPVASDHWGKDAIQAMTSEVGQPDMPSTSAATRKQLFLDYMDDICVDSSGQPFQIDAKTGFLAHNVDQRGKGDFQGCGEFNPVLIFSGQKNDVFEQDPDHTERNTANAPNRRVIALLYRPGSRVNPIKWPCPRATEPTGECRKRFWSDGDLRRNTRLPDSDRKFQDGQQTFACRFYQRMMTGSPCEGILPVWNIRVFDPCAVFMPNVPYRLTVGGDTREGKTDSQGWIRERSIQVPDSGILEWGVDTADPGISMYRMEVHIAIATEDAQDDQDRDRLHNLGYGIDCAFEDGVGHFQSDYGLPVTKAIDEESRRQLKSAHDRCVLREKPDPPAKDVAPNLQGESQAEDDGRQ
jgi:hypothetical protein